MRGKETRDHLPHEAKGSDTPRWKDQPESEIEPDGSVETPGGSADDTNEAQIDEPASHHEPMTP